MTDFPCQCHSELQSCRIQLVTNKPTRRSDTHLVEGFSTQLQFGSGKSFGRQHFELLGVAHCGGEYLFLWHGCVEETRFDGIHIHSEPLFLVTRRRQNDPPCDGQGTVDFEEIFGLPLVLSQGQHAVRAMVEETAAKLERRLDIRIATESSRLRMSYIRSGVTAGILPWPTFDGPWRRGELHARRIVKPDLVRRVNLAWPRNQPLNAASRSVRERLFVICQELLNEGVIRGEWTGAELPA